MGKRCNANLGSERICDGPWHEIFCLLDEGHETAEPPIPDHADWTAWIGVRNPDFSKPGASLDDKKREFKGP